MFTRFSVVALVVTFVACSSTPPPQAISDEAKAAAMVKAEEATSALVSTLIGRLSDALDEGETVDALNVCGDVAQEITEKVRREQGVDIHRTSLRVRNPLNAPDEYERAWLEANAERTEFAAGGEIEWVTRADGTLELRFLKPIRLGDACLQCHGQGDDIDAATREALAVRYPEDRATGYAAGQLRGIVSVRVVLAANE